MALAAEARAAARRARLRSLSFSARPSAMPIDALRLVVGALLLAFGLQWLRKAILRSSGFKPLHDEDEVFAQRTRTRRGRRRRKQGGPRLVRVHRRLQGRPAGGPRGRLHRDHLRQRPGPSSGSPPSARSPRSCSSSRRGRRARSLSRVPENTIKFAVGLLLTSFGCFWAAEGAGVDWPGDEVVAPRRDRVLRAGLVRARARAAAPALRSFVAGADA